MYEENVSVMCLLLHQPSILFCCLVLALASRAGPATFPVPALMEFLAFVSNKDLESDEKSLSAVYLWESPVGVTAPT